MRIILSTLLMLGALQAGAETFQAAVPVNPPTHPALYSFSDVYRLAVAGELPAPAGAETAQVPVRVAVTQQPLASELQFVVTGAAERQRWPLLLAGVAAALWVARRRLGYL